jgi:hypothetical protein
MNVPLYVVWNDLIPMVYWPLWVVPIYLFIRRKKIEHQWVFLFFAMLLCFIGKYSIEYGICDILFNSSSPKIDAFAIEHVQIIDDIIYMIGVLIPMQIVHFSSKSKYFIKKAVA